MLILTDTDKDTQRSLLLMEILLREYCRIDQKGSFDLYELKDGKLGKIILKEFRVSGRNPLVNNYLPPKPSAEPI